MKARGSKRSEVVPSDQGRGRESRGNPSDAADYEAVLGCWSAHYDTCYAEGGEVYESCLAACTDSDDACSQACNEPAMDTYAGCYDVACAEVYATCGIE